MKEGTKVLIMHGWFKLPDDFKGSFADALRAFADYHEKEGLSKPGRTVGERTNEPINMDTRWEEFVEAEMHGFKVHGGFGIEELKDNAFVPIENEGI